MATQIFLELSSLFGYMIQFDKRIFFRWVGEKPPTRSYYTPCKLTCRWLAKSTIFDGILPVKMGGFSWAKHVLYRGRGISLPADTEGPLGGLWEGLRTSVFFLDCCF